LLGPKGRTQKEMEDKTGAKIYIRGKGSYKPGMPTGHPDDYDELHVSVEGTQDAIDRASIEIEQVLFNPDVAARLRNSQMIVNPSQPTFHQNQPHSSPYNFSQPIPHPGSNLPHKHESAPMRSEFSSPHHQSDHYGPKSSNISAPSSGSPVILRVPKNRVGLIIGTGGDSIRTLQETTGATIQLVPENETPQNEMDRILYLSGSPEAIENAKTKIDALINFRTPPSGNLFGQNGSFPFNCSLTIPNDKVGLVIGKGGQTMKSIHSRTGATVFIPPEPDANDFSSRTLQISGPSQQVIDQARHEILSLVEMGTNQAPSVFVVVPNDKVGLLIGKGGTTVKDMQHRHRCKIIIPVEPDPGSNPPIRTCGIVGPMENANNAKYEIEVLIGSSQQMSSSSMYSSHYGYQQNYQQSYNYPYDQYGQQYQAPPSQYPSYSQYPPQQAQQSQQIPNYGSQYSQPANQFNPAQQPQPQQQSQPQQQQSFDPSMYYEQFWQYAAYYGEEAARRDYSAYSAYIPPVGTPPPPHIQLPNMYNQQQQSHVQQQNNENQHHEQHSKEDSKHQLNSENFGTKSIDSQPSHYEKSDYENDSSDRQNNSSKSSEGKFHEEQYQQKN